ncbi:MAG: hypothetical protein M4579_003887 [Chaenotheca gracillima]|nr:MAG: hypothetical protein M4579_003887 [Chaenotheca gracillima]
MYLKQICLAFAAMIALASAAPVTNGGTDPYGQEGLASKEARGLDANFWSAPVEVEETTETADTSEKRAANVQKKARGLDANFWSAPVEVEETTETADTSEKRAANVQKKSRGIEGNYWLAPAEIETEETPEAADASDKKT